MSSIACGDTAGLTALTTYFQKASPITRQSGGSFLLFWRCDFIPTDITSTTEIDAAITANQLKCTPCGIWTMSAPTSDIITVDGCGTKLSNSDTYTIDFSTYYFSDGCEDVKFWKDLVDQANVWRVVPITCQNRYFITDDWFNHLCDAAPVPTTVSPGHSFSFLQKPHQVREGDALTKATWNFQLEVVKDGMFCDFAIPNIDASLCQD